MPLIDFNDFNKANTRWSDYFKVDPWSAGSAMSEGFREACDIQNERKQITWADRPAHSFTKINVPEKCARMVKMLNSPHWETLLKAYIIQNEEAVWIKNYLSKAGV